MLLKWSVTVGETSSEGFLVQVTCGFLGRLKATRLFSFIHSFILFEQ